MDFFSDEQEEKKEPPSSKEKPAWKIAIIDDEPEVHQVTKLALRSAELDGRCMQFISAYSGEEGFELLRDTDDIAVALIDVVMEADDAGLKLIRRIRDELNNHATRIILRTGQPGQAPEEQVIRDYDINDYKAKTELTAMRLKSCIYSTLRSYRDIRIIEESRRGMESVIGSCSSVLRTGTLNQFGSAVLAQTLSLLNLEQSALYLTSQHNDLYDDQRVSVLAATGDLVNVTQSSDVSAVPEEIRRFVEHVFSTKTSLILEDTYVGYYDSGGGVSSVLFLKHDAKLSDIQLRLLEMFSANVALIFENLNTKEDVLETQKELIQVMGDAIEARSKETGAHVRRVSLMCELLAQKLGMNDEFVQTLRFSAPLHDVGKIAIPETILHKPSKLDPNEWEEMKSHALRGYELLESSNRLIAKMGARIAITHHECWDGSGYPNGLKGEEICLEGRIMAVVDVIDALLSKRSYKEPWEPEKVKEYIAEKSGTQFDPNLVQLCIEHFDAFLKIRDDLPDD